MSPLRFGLSLLFVLILGFKLGQWVFDNHHEQLENTEDTPSNSCSVRLESVDEHDEKNNPHSPARQHAFGDTNGADDAITLNSLRDNLTLLQNTLHNTLGNTSNEDALRIFDKLALVEDSALFDKGVEYLQSHNASEQELALILLSKAIDNNNQAAIQSTIASAQHLLTRDANTEQEASRLMNLLTQAATVSNNNIHKEQSHSLLLSHSYSDSLFIKMQAARGLVALAPENPATQDRMYELLTESFSVEEKIASLSVLLNSSKINELTLTYVSQLAESSSEPIAVRTQAMALLNQTSRDNPSNHSY